MNVCVCVFVYFSSSRLASTSYLQLDRLTRHFLTALLINACVCDYAFGKYIRVFLNVCMRVFVCVRVCVCVCVFVCVYLCVCVCLG